MIDRVVFFNEHIVTKAIQGSEMKLAYDLYKPPGGSEDNCLSPIIFVHGGMDSRKTWKKFGPDVAKRTGRQVYAIDLRNHGESPWSDEMNRDVLISDVEKFMKDHDMHKAILIGHSLGGKVCMAFALEKPGSVEKLVIEDTHTQEYDFTTKLTIHKMHTLLRNSINAIPPKSSEIEARTAVFAYIQKYLPPVQPGLKGKSIYDLDAVPIKKEGDTYVWQANMDVLDTPPNSNQPNNLYSGVYPSDALFLYGTKSFVNVKDDDNIYKHFPKATKVPFEGAGHLIHQVCPEEFLNHIIDFILK